MMPRDLKNAVRSLAKAPGFTFAAALTLALGIGANTAIFSVINDVLLRDLPYAEPERLVMLWEHNTRRDWPMNVVSPANFQDWRDNSKSFEAMGAFFERSFTLTGAGDPVEVRATAVTANMFQMLVKIYFSYFPQLHRVRITDNEPEARAWLEEQLQEIARTGS